MGKAFLNWAFPPHTRLLKHARGISLAVRTIHIAAFGILLGGYVFTVAPTMLLPSLYLTILGGLGLMVLEAYGVGFYWLFMGRGASVSGLQCHHAESVRKPTTKGGRHEPLQ
jgi:hypothetical protein